MRTIYLAGPEVFLPDAREVMAGKRRLAEAHGFTVTGPGSDEQEASAGLISAQEIYRRNEKAMLDADYCLANITPFRSISGDVGTVYEIGFMLALKRKVWAYSNDPRPHGERVWTDWLRQDGAPQQRGPDGLAIEIHGLTDNLMIDLGIMEGGGQVLRAAASLGDPARDLTIYEQALALMAKA